MLVHSPNLYRLQISTILFGIVAPWIANALYIAKATPIANLDLTPFAFTGTGLAFAWSLFRLHFLELVPLANNAVIEGMRDGVVVLDQLQRIVGANPAAAKMLGRTEAELLGRHARVVLPSGVARVLDLSLNDNLQITLLSEGFPHTYDLSCSELRNHKGVRAGQVLVMRDITLRHRAEEALRASEERYRLMSELTSDYTYSLSLQTDQRLTIDWVTDAFIRITGYTKPELEATADWSRFVDPADLPIVYNNARLLSAVQSTACEFRIVTKSGATRWIRSYTRPIRDDDQQRIVRILGAGQDITERKHAEEALRSSEERYRHLFDSSPNPMWTYDIHAQTFLAVNDAAVEQYGYARERFLQMRIEDIRPTEDVPFLLEDCRAGSQGPSVIVERHKRHDGTIITVQVTSQPVSFLGAGARITLAVDITEQTLAEAALRQRNEYLAALHETTLALVNRLEVDDVLQAIVVRAGALVGTTHGYIYLVEPETDELVVRIGIGYYQNQLGYRIRHGENQGLAGLVRVTGKPVALEDYQAWEGRRTDFDGEPIHAVATVPLTSEGRVIGMIGLAYLEPGYSFGDDEMVILGRFAQLASVALDNAFLYTTAQQELADRKRAEADLALARDQALEAARLKAGFLATMSHELRTPLNAIIGFTDLTLEETSGTLNQMQRGNLRRVSRNARELLTMIDSILDMSKIDAGYMQLVDEHVFLEEIVWGALGDIETLISAKRLQVSVRRSQGPYPLVHGDSSRLHQIVLNLLSNAVKFTPDHGTIILVLEWGMAEQLEAAAPPGTGRPTGEWVTLSVCDSGIGIQADQHERIWSEFYQVDNSATRQYAGTGLGLAIVKRLTLMMNGQVGVTSQSGRGSTFTIWLPAQGYDDSSAGPTSRTRYEASVVEEATPW